MTAVTAWEMAARQFETRPRRWASPGAMAQEFEPRTVQTPALELIDSALVDVADGRCKRLMIFLPPQEGKSERASRRFPLWLLEQNPDLRIAIASYEFNTARRWGRAIRNDLAEHGDRLGGLRVRTDTSAANEWAIDGRLGGVYTVGIGGALTSRPVDVLIIDDPVKGRAEAESKTYREQAWDFWKDTARTRLAPGAPVVVIQTRWHDDDLSGRLLAQGGWRVISIPAQAEDDDPLGRAPGEWLQSARGRTAADWEETRREVGEYTWASLYQQRPTPAEGGLFKRDGLRYWRPALDDQLGPAIDLPGLRRVWLRDCYLFATADLAASTRTSADWSVISIWAHTQDEHLVLLDWARARVDETRHWRIARPLVERWHPEWVGVEDTKKAMTLVADLVSNQVRWRPLNPITDKVTRALPAAARVDEGRVWLPAEHPRLHEVVDELLAFPNAAHDDIVDTLSYAAIEVAPGRSTGPVGIPGDGRTIPGDMAPAEIDWDTAAF